jgi:hypothetical protein
MWRFPVGDEKLGTVCVLTGIGHGQKERLSMLQFEVLIPEFFTINTFSTSSIKRSKVTTLGHETSDNSVEDRALKVQRLLAIWALAFLSGTETSEVFSCLGNNVCKEFHLDALLDIFSDFDVEINTRIFGSARL